MAGVKKKVPSSGFAPKDDYDNLASAFKGGPYLDEQPENTGDPGMVEVEVEAEAEAEVEAKEEEK